LSSPTSRSMELLRKDGATVAIVERWCSFTRKRYDLFGIIDLLAVKEGETIAVQTTSYSNVSARVKKIEESEHIAAIRKAGWRVLVHGWKKNKAGRWECRVVDVS